jgi:hypothetical protein
MFKNKRNTKSPKKVSSYDDGKASIIVQPNIKAPVRSSSLFNSYSQEIFQLQQEINNKKPIDEFEEVELVEDDTSSSSTLSSSEDDELSLSAAEVAASVRSSRIIPSSNNMPPIENSKKKQNRLSRMIFGWSSSKKPTPTTIQKASLPSIYDDGREELLYRGIQVKELRTTLNPMVLPLANQIPQPQSIQRPEFTRLSY